MEKAGYYYTDELLGINVDEVAKKTGLDSSDLQKWKNYVHLMKVRTVGPAYANILHRDDVGICTTKDLATVHPAELLNKMTASNKHRRLVKILPNLKRIERWIETAKKLT